MTSPYDATANYASLTTYKTEIGETSSANDTRHTLDLTEASRVIDRLCGVPAGYWKPSSSGQARVYDVGALDTMSLFIDAAQAITAVKIDDDDDGVYETTLTLTTDYRLYPLDGPPYREVRINRASAGYTFPTGDATVQVTGTWGEDSTVPLPIQRAVRLLANRYRVRPNTPEGISSGGATMMALGAVDPDILTILNDGHYRRSAVFA